MNTIVLGASPSPERYSHLAVLRLLEHGHKVWAIGKRPGMIGAIPIDQDIPAHIDVDTVTLYLHPDHQIMWYEKILQLKPRRIIFNPGAENQTLAAMAAQQGIEATDACTLVLLATGAF